MDKKVVILVIASRNNSSVNKDYDYRIKKYWTPFIEHCNKNEPNIDIFLVYGNDVDLTYLSDTIRNNIIVSNNPETYKPGILSKTIYSFNKVRDKYDYYFRTNLSSIILLDKFKPFINNWDYGAGGWVIPDKGTKCINHDEEFISGCCILLNNQIINSLLDNLDIIDFSKSDDIAISDFLYKKHSVNRVSILRFDKHINHTIFKLLNDINNNQDLFLIRSDRNKIITLDIMYNTLNTYKLLY